MKHTFTLKNNKKLFSLLGLLLLAFTSCQKKDDIQINGTAYIQMTNASQDDSPIDFYVSSTKKNAQPLAFDESTNYFSIAAGKTLPATIKVNSTGNTLASLDLTPLPNVYYSIFYFGGITVSYIDDLTVVTGKARVRFLNLNKGITTNLNYGITGASTPLVTGLAPAFDSAYYTVDAGSSFTVYDTGSTTSKLAVPTTIEAGHVYTIYLSGNTAADLKATVLLQK